MPDLHITGDAAADELLTENPLALLIGMLLDQQVAMEVAFAGPAKIAERAGAMDASTLAGYDPVEFAALFAETPAVHRFPKAMAERVQLLCQQVRDEWNGDAAAIWSTGDTDGIEVLARLKKLPGFGQQKAMIFLALLGKQYGYYGAGWREAAGKWGEQGSFRSVADVIDHESLLRVRETKRAAKAPQRPRNETRQRRCRYVHRPGHPAAPPRRCPHAARADAAGHTAGVGCLYVKNLQDIDLSVPREHHPHQLPHRYRRHLRRPRRTLT